MLAISRSLGVPCEAAGDPGLERILVGDMHEPCRVSVGRVSACACLTLFVAAKEAARPAADGVFVWTVGWRAKAQSTLAPHKHVLI